MNMMENVSSKGHPLLKTKRRKFRIPDKLKMTVVIPWRWKKMRAKNQVPWSGMVMTAMWSRVLGLWCNGKFQISIQFIVKGVFQLEKDTWKIWGRDNRVLYGGAYCQRWPSWTRLQSRRQVIKGKVALRSSWRTVYWYLRAKRWRRCSEDWSSV